VPVIDFDLSKRKPSVHQNRIKDPHRWLASGLRQIAAAESADARAASVETLYRQLGRHGRSFDDIATLVERVGLDAQDDLLEPDSPFNAETLGVIYKRYGAASEFTAHLIWCGSALRRLKGGQEPTIDDRRQRAQLLAKLRGALR
jgi:hypothetical protein